MPKLINQALKDTAGYLYSVEGEYSPEFYQFIATLRQLINEEFVVKGKIVSSQFLYDYLKDKVEL